MKKKALTFFLCLSFISCTGGGNGTSGVDTSATGIGAGFDTDVNTTDGSIQTGGNIIDSIPTGGTDGTITGDDGVDFVNSTIVVGAPATNALSVVQSNIPFSNSNLLLLELSLSTATAFQVVLQDTSNAIATLLLLDPNGNEIVALSEQGDFTTTALFPTTRINTLNYQTNDEDPNVFSGTYTHAAFIDGNTNGSITATVLAKNDLSFSSGTVPVNLFFVGELAQNDSIAIQAAMDETRSIFDQIGLSINLSLFNVPSSNGELPCPISGSNFYANQGFVSTSNTTALNIYVGDFVSNSGLCSSLGPVLGVASAIPGPAILTDFSAVAISLSLHQGVNGVLDGSEIELLGETIAHEAGHFLGLFHPVEINFTDFDPLNDTEQCTSNASCVSSDLVNNLMFPFPVSGVAQRNLTNDQSGVLHRNVLVN